MNEFYGDFYQKQKGDWIFDIAMLFLSLVVLYTFTWLVAGLRSDSHCVDTQTVTEVQATGHKDTTNYYVRGDKGGVIQGDTITQVGDRYCFKTDTTNYYKFRNYFKPWENN